MPVKSSPLRVLVLGGARSGKSDFALKLAERWWKRPLYLATAEATDKEMVERIRTHRRSRGSRWFCVEEPLRIDKAILASRGAGGILIDCLTLWLNNVLHKEGPAAFTRRKDALLHALRATKKDVILVSNEVGLGIVPEHKMARVFRDLAGRLNQELALEADIVVMLVSGLPLVLKGRLPAKR